MNAAEKRFARMRDNPRGGWSIQDVEAICNRHDITCNPPRGGGSHYTVAHPSQAEILTIPAHKPIKAVYIRKLVSFIETVIGHES